MLVPHSLKAAPLYLNHDRNIFLTLEAGGQFRRSSPNKLVSESSLSILADSGR